MPFAVLLTAVLGTISAARAVCDFACIAQPAAPQSAQGHCASHSESQPPVPVRPVDGCGHNHGAATLSLVRTAAANLDVTPSAAIALPPEKTVLPPALTTRRLLTADTRGGPGSRAYLLLPLRI
jgi:hypothetical protein